MHSFSEEFRTLLSRQHTKFHLHTLHFTFRIACLSLKIFATCIAKRWYFCNIWEKTEYDLVVGMNEVAWLAFIHFLHLWNCKVDKSLLISSNRIKFEGKNFATLAHCGWCLGCRSHKWHNKNFAKADNILWWNNEKIHCDTNRYWVNFYPSFFLSCTSRLVFGIIMIGDIIIITR